MNIQENNDSKPQSTIDNGEDDDITRDYGQDTTKLLQSSYQVQKAPVIFDAN